MVTPQLTGQPAGEAAPALVGLDWGSSALRAFLFDGSAAVLEERTSEEGASRLVGGAAAFERALRQIAGDWLQTWPNLPVLACGMVGSRHGWREAPYVACPFPLNALHRHSVVAKGSNGLCVRILPGVGFSLDSDRADVMRGEETQVAGLLAAHPALAARCRVLLPGTHCKWVKVRRGSIVGFRTCITGELFALLRQYSVLGRLMSPGTQFDPEGFEEGVRRAQDDAGRGLAWDLFSVRARALIGQLQPPALAGYLSGLLIGHEVGSGLVEVPVDEPIALVGDPVLCSRYERALQVQGRTATALAGNTSAQGLWLQAASHRT